jgi:hypothetical protein
LRPLLGDTRGDGLTRSGVDALPGAISKQTEDIHKIKTFMVGDELKDVVKTAAKEALQEQGVTTGGATVSAELTATMQKMNEQMTAMTTLQQQMQQQMQQQQQQATLDVPHTYDHGDGTSREIPTDFKLPNTTIVDGWRFWNLGNRHAGASRQPVIPYKKLGRNDFKGNVWKTTAKTMSKWRQVFNYLEQKLTATDTATRKWQQDGATHFLTLNRLNGIIPSQTNGTYSVNVGANSISTVYNHLVKMRKSAATT